MGGQNYDPKALALYARAAGEVLSLRAELKTAEAVLQSAITANGGDDPMGLFAVPKQKRLPPGELTRRVMAALPGTASEVVQKAAAPRSSVERLLSKLYQDGKVARIGESGFQHHDGRGFTYHRIGEVPPEQT